MLPSEGMGCFAKGCLALLIAGFVFFVGMIGVGWVVYVKTITKLTSPAAADIQVPQPTEQQFQNAETSAARLKEAVAKNEETTVEFTAADLNALLARDRDFEDFRGRIRVDMADSIMTVEVSASLNSVPLPKMKQRWFNGTARFSFSYRSGRFKFDIRSAEAGGDEVPDIFLSESAISAFNDNFDRGFWEAAKKSGRSQFWEHVKSMSVEGDKLIVKIGRAHV